MINVITKIPTIVPDNVYLYDFGDAHSTIANLLLSSASDLQNAVTNEIGNSLNFNLPTITGVPGVGTGVGPY